MFVSLAYPWRCVEGLFLPACWVYEMGECLPTSSQVEISQAKLSFMLFQSTEAHQCAMFCIDWTFSFGLEISQVALIGYGKVALGRGKVPLGDHDM